MRIGLGLALIGWLGTVAWNAVKPLPDGTHVASLPTRIAGSQLDVLGAPAGAAVLSRELALIDRAQQLIVLDQSPLLRDIGQHLLLRKRQRPGIKIVVLADPLPERYGGTPAHYLESLERAGIIVARTRLSRLRDPLAWYSGLWRLGIGWWSDPYDEARPASGVLAALRRLNAKADGRQLLVVDDAAGGWVGLLPANRDGPLGVEIAGGVARDMAASELKIAAWSTGDDRLPPAPAPAALSVGSIDARFLTEGAIAAALADAIGTAAQDDEVDLSTAALGERRVAAALVRAAHQGARLRLLLDAGAAPNRILVAELGGESGARLELRRLPPGASAVSLVLVRHRRELWAGLSSAELSRAALGDLNLSAALELRLQEGAPAAQRLAGAFEAQWSRSAGY